MKRTKMYIKKYKEHWACVTEFENGFIGIDLDNTYNDIRRTFKELKDRTDKEEWTVFSTWHPSELQKEIIDYVKGLNGKS